MADEKEPRMRELARARGAAKVHYGLSEVLGHARDAFIIGWMARAELEKAHPLFTVSIPMEMRRE